MENNQRKVEIELTLVEKRFYKYKAKRLQLIESFVKKSKTLADLTETNRIQESYEYLDTLNYLKKEIKETEKIMKICLKKRQNLNKRYWEIEKILINNR